jgi:hypothetical protein
LPSSAPEVEYQTDGLDKQARNRWRVHTASRYAEGSLSVGS